MKTYVRIKRADIVARLEAAGFHREDVQGEVTYFRRHQNDRSFAVRVYTSVPQFDTVARGPGADAIRIVASHEWVTGPNSIKHWKTHYKARVNRVGTSEEVLDRMISKARLGYSVLNRVIRERRALLKLALDKRIYKDTKCTF